MYFSEYTAIQWLKVNTDTNFAILLRDDYRAGTSRGRLCYFGNYTSFFHMIELICSLLMQWERNMSGSENSMWYCIRSELNIIVSR